MKIYNESISINPINVYKAELLLCRVYQISGEYLAFFHFFVSLILNYMIKHIKIVPVFSEKVFLFNSPYLVYKFVFSTACDLAVAVV